MSRAPGVVGTPKADRRAYQTAVGVLRDAIDTSDFKEAHKHAEKCREAFERSREALELHDLKNGCGLPCIDPAVN
jgi:hypothetical protein